MKRDTLTINGVKYDLSDRQVELLEIIRQDHFAEMSRIREENPFSGSLDGPFERLKRESINRLRQRAVDLLEHGIEPIPDKETGLGAWA